MAVALYARVSTTRQADKDLSIPDQLRQMRDWCEKQGLVVGTEYIEPGASATDDRRPEFQKMIGDATFKPSPYEAVIVHSQSRFFRDSLEFGLYERRLNKAGVRLISITQQTSDDSSGQMMRKIFSVFDEYQSKENGKHTLRAMKENARQGYFNGSKPPFGFKKVELDISAAKGKKKKLVVDEVEAAIVHKIFNLYLHGAHGQEMGTKQIASYLNDQGILNRSKKWSRNRIHQMLSDTAYFGQYFFNRKDMKTGQTKPVAEWVPIAIPAIIDEAMYRAVEAKRYSRSPDMMAPRLVNSPTLLTGLLKCGNCGAGMTLATGKGGRYRYYKCNTRIAKNNHDCDTPAIPMEKLDTLVLQALADKVASPERLKVMLKAMKAKIKNAHTEQNTHLITLKKELSELEEATARLYEAVEKGFLPMDGTLQERAQKLKARRESILIEMAGTRRDSAMPLDKINAGQIDAFGKAMRTKLLDRENGFSKQYLRLLVSEIRVEGKEVRMTGSKEALLNLMAQKKVGTAVVPTFSHSWLPDLDSNQGPAD
ncbi:recombinase family protein [Janthinobacterium sp. Marseille-P9896]|uniref:recombinase family protein n=1 Tax=Herminiimonas sp. Marseille-P9896 TaxID=2742211 RepID=UPI0034C6D642